MFDGILIISVGLKMTSGIGGGELSELIEKLSNRYVSIEYYPNHTETKIGQHFLKFLMLFRIEAQYIFCLIIKRFIAIGLTCLPMMYAFLILH